MELGGNSETLSSPNIQSQSDQCKEVSMNIDDKADEDSNENLCGSKKRSRTVASRSQWWDHFDVIFCETEKIKKGRCKYCSREIKADPKLHGTRTLRNHYESCKKKPHEVETNQNRLSFQLIQKGDKEAPLVNWRFEQEKVRDALCYMLIVDELPFKTVENHGFRHFLSVACPMFDIPSRRTITREIYKSYLNEKVKLKQFIKDNCQRMCITTDTWTSIQKVNYMCLTAHFVDENWNLHKRILNFCPISGHKGEEIGKGIEKCLLDWGIDKIFSITVDNASSNDVAIGYLKKRFDNWGSNIMGGRYVHVRCIAHIINLVVQDGLKGNDEHLAISRVRGAVRYIRSSPARYKRFQECVQLEKLETNKLLTLDVPTRWNSTYLMLDSAIGLKRAFDAYDDADLSFRIDLSKKPFDGVPNDHDWDRCKLLLKFLKHFYKLTLRISGSLYVTSNIMFHEISEVDMLLKQWLDSADFELSLMARKMKEKYDKYWGSVEKMNLILYYAVILDPRHKLEFIEFSFDRIYGREGKNEIMKEQVRDGLNELFNDYNLRYSNKHPQASESLCSSSSGPTHGSKHMSKKISSEADDHETEMVIRLSLKQEFKMYKSGGKGEIVKSELEKYLTEDAEEERKNFDILKWWKENSPRFPILSQMARDILSVPVSTVASEAAFSTGGRVLDAFRSSLSAKIVQSLICSQDWFRCDSKPINVEEDLCAVEIMDKELTKLGVDSSIIDV